MGRTPAWACVSAAALVACGCTLTTSLDDLGDAGAHGGGAPDGGADTAGGAGGGGASGSAGAAGAPAFCATHTPTPRLCLDFDEGKPLLDQWTKSIGQGGMLTIDATASQSAPASLLATTDPFTGTYSQEMLARVFADAPPTNVHLEFSLRPNALGTQAVRYFSIIFTPAGSTMSYSLFFAVQQAQASITEWLTDGTHTDHPFISGRPQVGTWTQMTLDVAFDARTLAMSADGQSPFDGLQTLRADASSGAVELHLGIVNGYDPAGSSANFDNVLVDFR